jgi:hypothetical protein
MLHENALQAAQISELEEQLAVMTKRKTCKCKRIQYGSTIEYSEAAAQVATETSIAAGRSKKACGGGDQERAQPTVQRCGNCSKTGHNAQPCNKDAEISSESDASTSYTGFLFDGNEIEEL